MQVVWSVKGGVGVTVVAAALAAGWARRDRSVLLVDLCGDLPAVLGIAEPSGPGILDWLAAPDTTPAALERLSVAVGDGLDLVPVGSSSLRTSIGRFEQLASALRGIGRRVVVDAGRCGGPGVEQPRTQLVATLAEHGDSLLVTRPCYLSLRRAVASEVRPDGVVLVTEPGRALGRAAVGDLLRAPVVAQVEVDPAVSRSVDAGLLLRRRQRGLERSMRGLW